MTYNVSRGPCVQPRALEGAECHDVEVGDHIAAEQETGDADKRMGRVSVLHKALRAYLRKCTRKTQGFGACLCNPVLHHLLAGDRIREVWLIRFPP